MKAKHTPGPWTYELRESHDEYETPLFCIDAEDSNELVATVNPDNEANAILIASAPELLEALIAAKDVFELYYKDHYNGTPLQIKIDSVLTRSQTGK